MSSTSERLTNEQTRTYDRASSVVFLKTDAPFGGLSNMAGGFPLHVQGTRIYTSEALYQACRFPHLPEVQQLIIGQASPMTAKMKSKPHRKDSRPDWDRVRVKVMRWCLRVKLAQNWAKFSELLLRTDDRPIVEESRRDDFWGAKPVDEQMLVGMNVLGRLLMELREAVKSHGRDAFLSVEPPDIPQFLLLGRPITAISESELTAGDSKATPAPVSSSRRPVQDGIDQPSLFDAPSAREAPSPVYMTQKAPEGAPLGDLKPYPAMKDSGVPWLGQVPQHWTTLPLKRWVTMNRAVLPETTPGDYEFRYLDIGSVGTGVLTSRPQRMRFSAAPSRARRVVRNGDTIVSTVRTYLKAIYFVDHDADDLVCSTGFAVLTPRSGTEPKFVSYLCQSAAFTDMITADSVGIAYPAIAETRLGAFHVLVPPLPEQAAIVRFLDHADRRIRRYIRAKQKLIKLLEEQKAAIIHRAVTRGLDPDVRLKPSGVEWLGDVPEHWDVRPAKWFFREVDERSASGDEELLSVSHLTGVTPRSQKSVTMFMAESYVGHKVCRPGDLVINTMWAWMAALGVARQVGLVSPAYGVYRPRRGSPLIGDYADLLLRTRPYVSEYVCRSTGIQSSRLRLYPEQFLRIPVVCPPEAEQRTILANVGSGTAEMAKAVAAALREIQLLHEYRTRLIADVVTGKLDVRKAAARLPQEAEDVEPLDEPEALGEGSDDSAGDGLDPAPEEAEA